MAALASLLGNSPARGADQPQGEPGLPGLPHFARAIERLAAKGIAKDEILHVAQSKHHDVRPGRELDLTTVWVNRRHDRPGSGATLATEAEPHLTVNSLAELVALHKGRPRLASAG